MFAKNSFYCFLTLFMLESLGVFGQGKIDSIKLSIETLSSKDGLSQGFVRSIIQDKEGHMWFATKDGLNRYDGYHITVYRNEIQNPFSLPDNYVTSLEEDSFGNFWVGTATKGLLWFDKKNENFYPVNILPKYMNKPTKEIGLIKCQGNYMLLTTNHDIFIYDISQITPFTLLRGTHSIKLVFDFNKSSPKIPYETPSPFSPIVSWMPNHDLWICRKDGINISTFDSLLKKWQSKEYTLSDFGIKLDKPSSLYLLKLPGQQRYFMQFRERIAIYNDITHKLDFELKTELNDRYTLPVLDANGNILIQISSSFYLFNPSLKKLSKIITNDNEINLTGTKTCCIDKHGILWLGLNGFGIAKYDPRKQFIFTNTVGRTALFNSVSNQPLVIQAKRPKKFNPSTNTFEDLLPNLFLEQSFSFIVQDHNGIIWMKSVLEEKSHHYLTSLNPVTKAIKQFPMNDRFANQFESIFVDNQNQLWVFFCDQQKNQFTIRQFNALTNSYQDEFTFPIEPNYLKNYRFISQCWQDKKGILWLGSVQGLIRLDLQKRQIITWKSKSNDSTSLSANMIFSILPDPLAPNQFLWIGTNGGGLNRFEYTSGKFIHFTEKDGLPNNVVYGILSDQMNNLWMSTNNGISCYSPKLKTNKKSAQDPYNSNEIHFRNFNELDGFGGNEFNRYEFAKLTPHELIFGGVDGLSIFKPAELLYNESPPNIVLSNLSVFNNPIDYKTSPSIISKPIQYAKSITLSYDQNMFTLEFAGLDYSSADKKFYTYFLDGFNKNWIDNSTKNYASFTNLDPGEYTFNVTVCNRSGQYNRQWASIKIIITPPWWGTWWFRTFAFLSIFSLIYALYRYQLHQSLKLLILRNRIASDLHDEIGSTLSSISLYGESAKMMISENHPLNQVLTKINSSTHEMMESMSDIVWAINSKKDTFDDLIHRMHTFVYEVMEAKNCNVFFEANEQAEKVILNMEDRKNLYLLYKEIINNAAKHAQCDTIWISILAKNRTLVLSIRDNGKGFNMEENNQSMGGNGLHNIKNRANALKAKLSINSTIGKGTHIQISMKF